MYIQTTSYSKHSTYMTCKLKYKRRYIDRFIGEARNEESLSFGSYIHQIFESGYQTKDLEELKKLAKKHRAKFKIPKDYRQVTEICLQNFLRFNNDLTDTIGVEVYFKLEIFEGAQVEGYIDRVVSGKEGGLLIIDYKTSKKEKTKFELFKDEQLMTYCWAASKLYNVPINKIVCGHYYPRTNNFVTIKYSNFQIQKYLQNLTRGIWNIRKAKANEFPPCMNTFCDWCEYQSLCPLFVKDPQELQENIEEQIRKKEELEKEKLDKST